jgi:hypothetical protein
VHASGARRFALPRRYDPAVQPLQTEAAPRSVCARCRGPLPRPNGSATYVYGVGAVGYQSCPACGAKWRYLWHDQRAPRIMPTGRGRQVAVVGGVVLAVVVVVAGVALARSQRWSSGASAKTTDTTPSSTPASTVSKAEASSEYVKIADPMYRNRKAFMTWLRTTASSAPQYQVNDTVTSYMTRAQAELDQFDGLDRSRWPKGAADAVTTLVDADRTFVSDANLVQYNLLYSPSFIDKLNAEAVAVRDADNAVRGLLGLAPTT